VQLGLLRAKALSLLYCHPRCPILTALAERYVFLTRGSTPIFGQSFWEQKLAAEVLSGNSRVQEEHAKGITLDDRVDFEDLFGVSPEEQRQAEAAIRSCSIAPISDERVLRLFNDCPTYREYDVRFCGSSSELAG
jgi:hypothetical protein